LKRILKIRQNIGLGKMTMDVKYILGFYSFELGVTFIGGKFELNEVYICSSGNLIFFYKLRLRGYPHQYG
jgi:hypothetical protein